MAVRLSALEKDNAVLTTENSRLNGALEAVQAQLAASATTPRPRTTPDATAPFSFTCSDGAVETGPPSIVAVGSDLNVAACGGKIAFHSTECAVNPCQLLKDVEDLKTRFP